MKDFRSFVPILLSSVFILVCTWATPSLACSCAFPDQSPFVSSTVLPANAKGVLYYKVFDNFKYTDYQSSQFVISDKPEPPLPSHFELTALNSGTILKIANVRQLALTKPNESPARYYQLVNERLSQCNYQSTSQECREFSNLRSDDDHWMETLAAKGDLIEVTEEAKRAMGLFRIEPLNGFSPGEMYSIRTVDDESNQKEQRSFASDGIHKFGIDETSLPEDYELQPKTMGDLTFTQVSIPAGGACQQNILVDRQDLEYHLSDSTEKFRHAMLLFPQYRKLNSAQWTPWHYRPSACSRSKFGKIYGQQDKGLFYASCEESIFRRGPQGGSTYELQARYGILEVSDQLRSSEILTIDFPERSGGECNVEKLLTDSKTDGDLTKTRNEVCAFAQRYGGGNFKKTSPEFISSLVSFTESNDSKTKLCAIVSFSKMGYHFQNGMKPEQNSLLIDEVIPRLAEISASESSEQHVLAALESLKDIYSVLGPKYYLVSSTMPSTASAVVERLNSANKKIRMAAAGTLSVLGTEAHGVLDRILTLAVEGTSPNEALVLLAEIAPTNPKTISLMLVAEKRGEREAAAYAARTLARSGVTDKRLLSFLVTLAGEEDSTALEALASLGPAAKEAVPMLLELLHSTDSGFTQERVLNILVEATPQSPELEAAILSVLHNPHNEYVRSDAIEALGRLTENQGKLALELTKILKSDPTKSEVYAILKTLKSFRVGETVFSESLTPFLSDSDSMLADRVSSFFLDNSPLSTPTIVSLLNSPHAAVIRNGIDAAHKIERLSSRDKQRIADSLGLVVSDLTRSKRLHERALSLGHKLEIKHSKLCERAKRMAEAEHSDYTRKKYLRMSDLLCE